MNKQICVLEDTIEILEIITIILEEEQYQVFGFGTVSEFNANVDLISPDLCLLDVMLPDGSGLDVCRDLKLDEKTKHIPILMMTANLKIANMKEGCAAEEFIAKPFDIDQLAAIVNRLISDSQLQTSL
ncbi:response regulator transcription factor [Pedobacter sp. L105]|uniref:response regulator transcription factor n=1 Tax=Pedobacter sp. L105 TaxID=1641871 RepID=UPI00131E31D5|nr:response regulator [Pedobacter sp. L105]